MENRSSQMAGYLLAASLGALAGGAAVLVATRAIPKLMSQMMGNMMAQMQVSGCDPAEM